MSAGKFRRDSNYVLRSESDSIVEAMGRKLLGEFENQRRAQSAFDFAELAGQLRHVYSDGVRKLEEASRDWAEERTRHTEHLDEARITQHQLKTRFESLSCAPRRGYNQEDVVWGDGDDGNYGFSGSPVGGAASR